MVDHKSDVAAKPEQWTDEQWQAIIQTGNNLLVAAAAGSGKTSVLVERIIRKMTASTDPVGVDQLLVVTFTNAAAAEMRHRIGDALRAELSRHPQSVHLRRQLALLPRASITTIHSFCLGLLRQHYHAVDLDPDFRIADEMETKLLRQDVLEMKLEEWYEQDEAFCRLADTMVDGQDDSKLAAILLRLYDFSQSHPNPGQWLERAVHMFERAGREPLDHLPWANSVIKTIRLDLLSMLASVDKAIVLASTPDGPDAYVPLLEQERHLIAQAADACQRGWNELEQALRAVSFQRLPAVKNADPEQKELVQKLRGKVKDGVKGLLEQYFATMADDYIRDLAATAPYMRTLAEAVIQFGEAFQAAKRQRSIVDFNDLEHLALQVLGEVTEDGRIQPSGAALGLREQFAEVLVDEYQDINLVQETILRLVSREALTDGVSNRFMVGDVKQSIYRFRLAEPGLFMQKYLDYPSLDAQTAESEGIRIDLAANFRSRKEVVDAVNFLFRQIMSPGVGELDYDRSAELIGRAVYPDVEPERLAVEVHLIDRTAPEAEDDGSQPDNLATGESLGVAGAGLARTGLAGTGEAGNGEAGAGEADEDSAGEVPADEAGMAELEARLIARRIRQWMEPGEGQKPLLVFDKKTKGLRPLQYRDIVILLRATAGWAQPMMEELSAAGIPVYVEQSDGYFEATEVGLMLSLLKVIDNPLQDIPLAAVLRSPLVGLNEEQLAEIRIQQPAGPFHLAVRHFAAEANSSSPEWQQRLQAFLARVDNWRTRARQGALAELIAQIYRETGYLEYVSTLENGQQRKANLRLLYDRARQYEATSYRGLFRFLRFVERLQETGSDFGEARTIGEGEDVVRLMTIHKSKGLEFPVVFVAGLGKQFNMMDMRSSFLLHKDLGFGPQVTDLKLRLRYPSLAQLGIKHQLKRELLAEEMRVLYVALTRAREKLLLVGSSKKLEERVLAWLDQTGDGERLADVDLLRAKGYLDWIGSALVRHEAAGPLRSYAGGGSMVPGPETITDESRWSFHVHQAADLPPQDQGNAEQLALWDRLRQRLPLDDQPGDPQWQSFIEKQLSWTDPDAASALIPAKWSVSDLKRAAAGESASSKLPRISHAPRFLSQEAKHRFTAAERGTILHTVMQHVNLAGPLDEAALRSQVEQLVERQFLLPEEAEQVEVARIAAFFHTPVGQRLRNARTVYRELPFTMALPVHDVATGLDAKEEEQVIVQGVIDCLFEEADGSLILLDFKSDAIWGDAPEEAVRIIAGRYREQIRRYEQAIRQIWQREVAESWLYLFAADQAVPMKNSSAHAILE